MLGGIFFLNFFSRIFFAPLLPELERTLNLTHGQAGLFFFFISCGYFLSLLASGFICSRIGHKRSIILSMAGIGLSLGLLSLTTNIAIVRMAFFLVGLSAGAYLPSAIATISSLFKPYLRGRAFAVHELAPNLAFLTAPMYVALLLPHLSWRYLVRLPIAFLLMAGILYAFWGRDVRIQTPKPDITLYRMLLRHRDFQIMVILFSLGITSTLGIFSVLPTYLISVHGFTEHQANMLVGASRIPALGAALAGGFFADFFGHRRAMGLVLFCGGIMTILLTQDNHLLISAIWMQPIIAVCFFPAGFALLSRIGPPATRGITVSLTIPLAFVIGGGIMPAIITRMADYGLFTTAIGLTGILIAAGGFLVLLMQDTSQPMKKSSRTTEEPGVSFSDKHRLFKHKFAINRDNRYTTCLRK